MTLIATYINKYGIVLASDSNLTSIKGNSGFGQKVFPIPHLNAGTCYSGLYKISGKDVDDWMNEFILESTHTTSTIKQFVEQLTTMLNLEYKGDKNDVSIIHIAGYSKLDYQYYVEHWHISNTQLDSKTGDYSNIKERFEFSNDFNSKTSKINLEEVKSFDTNPETHSFYVNGFPPARILFTTIKKEIEYIIPAFAEKEEWSFRPPKNIFESKNRVKMYFNLVGELFKMSDYEAMFVGGETQTYVIPAPKNLYKG